MTTWKCSAESCAGEEQVFTIGIFCFGKVFIVYPIWDGRIIYFGCDYSSQCQYNRSQWKFFCHLKSCRLYYSIITQPLDWFASKSIPITQTSQLITYPWISAPLYPKSNLHLNHKLFMGGFLTPTDSTSIYVRIHIRMKSSNIDFYTKCNLLTKFKLNRVKISKISFNHQKLSWSSYKCK